MTTITHPTLQHRMSALKSSGHSIRQRLFQFKETNPAYLDCFGDEAHSTESKTFGKITLWRITGELAYTATKIQDTLVKLIAEKRAVWQSRRPSETSPFEEPTYLIQCFLIGVSKAHAAPYVTIVSSVEWFSNCLKGIILKGKILAAYPGWRCFRLPLEPQLTAPGRLQMGIPANLDGLDLREYDVYLPGSKVPTHINASKVEIWKGQSFVGHATVGGMVTVGDEDLALTVAHAFVVQKPPIPVSFEIDDSELDLFDYYDSEEDTEIPWLAAASPDITPSPPPGVLDDSLLSPPDFTEDRILVGRLACVSNMQNEGPDDSGTLDWALIKITDPRISKKNRSSPNLCHSQKGPRSSDDSVTILTSSASLDALLVSDGLFGIPGFTNPQPVRVANIGTVHKGDSGSWAIQRNTRKPLGMLVGSCPPLNESYVVGLEGVLQDIELQTGLVATIASSDHPSQFEQLNFFQFINGHKRSGMDGQGNEAGYVSLVQLKTYWVQNRLLECLGLNPCHVQGREICIAYETMDRYLRIWSLLVYIGEHELFPWFISQDFHDECLPVFKPPLKFPGSQHAWEMFRENQWMFIPMLFDSNNMFKGKLHPRTVLPIITERLIKERGQGDSVHSCLTKVHLDIDCIAKGSTSTMTLKTYSPAKDQPLLSNDQTWEMLPFQSREAAQTTGASQLWEAEWRAWKVLNERGGSQHLLNPIEASETGGKGFVLLHGTTLEDFFRSTEPPKDPVRLLEFWENLFDLLKGVERLHHFPIEQQPEHSTAFWSIDIKPENILVIQPDHHDMPKFKLANFHLHQTTITQPSQVPEPGSLRVPNHERSDIWNLGCILMEVLIWVIQGTSHRETCDYQVAQQQESWRRHQEALEGMEKLDRVSSVIRDFIQSQMMAYEPGSAREIYRRFHDDVLPVADLSEDEALEHREYVPELSRDIRWETRSQRRSASSNATSDESDVDSGVFSGTAASSITKPASSIPADKQDVQRQDSLDDSGQPLMTVNDISRWMLDVPKATTAGFGPSPGLDTASRNGNITTEDDEETKITHHGTAKSMEEMRRRLRSPIKPLDFARLRGLPSTISHQLGQLGDRDKILLVDDSASMRQHWDSVSEACRALQWLCSSGEGDSMDLFFTSDPLMGYQRKKRESLADIARSQPPSGICRMRSSLEVVFDRIITDKLYHGGQAHGKEGWNRRPTTVFVLTDGVWQPSSKREENAAAGVDLPIKRMMDTLHQQGKNSSYVCVQFIRFGNDDSGTKRLAALDHLHEHQPLNKDNKEGVQNMDIFNVKSDQASVWDMLLGAVGRPVDGEVSSDGNAT
ncbi:hypothetical protein B0T10DRAFT_78265 [Thelonectria olida]|uniref:Protein kinase domain-containing protein n=1 Tax=Thelonectria olida TaxID=1576542 RepID=A0A9P8VZN6_9HYPO|nr:hypothetical protein B0T10DRAFT_78265 [Thelonectria olida]